MINLLDYLSDRKVLTMEQETFLFSLILSLILDALYTEHSVQPRRSVRASAANLTDS